MSGLCKDCKWWDKGPPRSVWVWGDCLLTQGNFAYPEMKGSIAVAGARGDAVLITRHDFGCNQFEARHIRGEE